MKLLCTTLALALALPFVLASCWDACTADDCFDRAVILVRAENWAAGSYVFEGTFEGRSFTCEMQLPWLETSPAPLCDTEDVSLGAPAFGKPPPPGSDAMIDIHDSDPKQVELRVLRDDLELVAQTVAIDYERVTAGCDQVCQQGEAVLALP